MREPDYKTRYGMIYHGDAMDILKEIEDNSIDTVITDPPYGLSDHSEKLIREVLLNWLQGNEDYVPNKKGFMSKEWDAFVPPPALWKEVYRVMKPGGTTLVFAGTRTYDLMTLSLRLAGFEIKDTLMWLYGCVSEDTEILTTNGWKKWNELSEGEEIYNLNLLNGKIEKDIVLEKFVYDIEDELINIKNDNTDQLITKNHKVILKYHTSHKWTWKYAKMIMTITKPIFIPAYNIMNKTITSIPINANDIKIVKYKGKVWSIRTNNMTYIARRNGKIFITGNSGFPKAQDMSKMIDKKLGKLDEREIDTTPYIAPDGRKRWGGRLDGKNYKSQDYGEYQGVKRTLPATPEAKQWEGYKTHALKPAYEPIIMAIKPNEGSYADNALKWGVAGLNVDEARIGNDKIFVKGGKKGGVAYGDWNNEVNTTHYGRFPANILLDEEAAEMLDEQSGYTKGGKYRIGCVRKKDDDNLYQLGFTKKDYRTQQAPDSYGDSGGASRFFYVAKASSKERNIGLNNIIINRHPTVKPVKLIEYLVKLTKMPNPNQIYLDPFLGSGTTGMACENLKRKWIGIEIEKEYADISYKRVIGYTNDNSTNKIEVETKTKTLLSFMTPFD